MAGFLTYSNALHGPFMVDDHSFFDERMKNIKFLKYQFMPDRDHALGIGGGHPEVYYRPLALAIPMLCYLAFGEHTFYFHVFNLILFCLTSFFIYVFVATIFKDRWLGFLTGLFFLVHPINGIVVNFITASVFPVQVIFMFASLSSVIASERSERSNLFKLLSIFFFALALMCHETSMALPIYAFCLLFLVQGYRWREALIKCLPMLIFLFIYFLWRLKYASLNVSIFQQISHFHINFAQYVATFTKIVCWYLAKLFCMGGIVMIWSAPVVTAGVAWWLLIALLLFVAYLAAVIYYHREKWALLGLIWFALGFLPLTLACLFQPTQGFIMEPHWLIFPSIGIFIFCAGIFQKINPAFVRIMLIGILLTGWSLTCRAYNYIWSDEERYCQFWTEQSPDFKGAKFFLARTYLAKGELEKAKYYYQACISNMYVDHLFYANLGLIDYLQGHWQAAKENYYKALSIEPRLQVVLINLGVMAMHEGNLPQAKQYFARAIDANRFSVAPRMNMAHLLEMQGDLQGATAMYRSILDIIPHDEKALISLLKIYYEHHDRLQVLALTTELMEHNPTPQTRRNVGIILKTLN